MKYFFAGFALGLFLAKPFFDCNGKALEEYHNPREVIDTHLTTEDPLEEIFKEHLIELRMDRCVSYVEGKAVPGRIWTTDLSTGETKRENVFELYPECREKWERGDYDE